MRPVAPRESLVPHRGPSRTHPPGAPHPYRPIEGTKMTIHFGRKASCRLPAPRLRIARRIGKSPQERGSTLGATCPDVFALTDGRIAVIGTERTSEVRADHPEMRPLAHGEKVVVVDAATLAHAREDLSHDDDLPSS